MSFDQFPGFFVMLVRHRHDSEQSVPDVGEKTAPQICRVAYRDRAGPDFAGENRLNFDYREARDENIGGGFKHPLFDGNRAHFDVIELRNGARIQEAGSAITGDRVPPGCRRTAFQEFRRAPA
jgi:hypothetical protein